MKIFPKKRLTIDRRSGVIGGLFTNEWRKSFGNEKKKFFEKKLKNSLTKKTESFLMGGLFTKNRSSF